MTYTMNKRRPGQWDGALKLIRSATDSTPEYPFRLVAVPAFPDAPVGEAEEVLDFFSSVVRGEL